MRFLSLILLIVALGVLALAPPADASPAPQGPAKVSAGYEAPALAIWPFRRGRRRGGGGRGGCSGGSCDTAPAACYIA